MQLYLNRFSAKICNQHYGKCRNTGNPISFLMIYKARALFVVRVKILEEQVEVYVLFLSFFYIHQQVRIAGGR